jgi:hypothetical protein
MNAMHLFPKQTALSSVVEQLIDHLTDALEEHEVAENFYKALSMLISHSQSPQAPTKAHVRRLIGLLCTIGCSAHPDQGEEARALHKRFNAASTVVCDLVYYWAATEAERHKMRLHHWFNDQLRHATIVRNEFHNIILMEELNGRRPAKVATNPAFWDPESKMKTSLMDTETYHERS